MKVEMYTQVFLDNPKGLGESVSQYYQRISKITNTSVRTIERHYPSFSKQTNTSVAAKLKVEEIKDAPPEIEMHIVLPDLHIPFENQQLIYNIVNFIDHYKPQISGIHFIGDMLDMLGLSTHELNSIPMPNYNLGIEYEIANAYLDLFNEVLPTTCVKNFLYGNHEDRFFRYMKNINNVPLQGALSSPTEALNLKERGYTVYENWKEDHIQLGKLQLIHGYFLGVNPCRQHLTRMKSSVMFGHSHRISSYYEGDQAAFNIGFLGDIHSDGFNYASRYEKMNWKNGFGVVYVDRHTGNFQADTIHCLNNTFNYGGKLFNS